MKYNLKKNKLIRKLVWPIPLWKSNYLPNNHISIFFVGRLSLFDNWILRRTHKRCCSVEKQWRKKTKRENNLRRYAELHCKMDFFHVKYNNDIFGSRKLIFESETYRLKRKNSWYSLPQQILGNLEEFLSNAKKHVPNWDSQ